MHDASTLQLDSASALAASRPQRRRGRPRDTTADSRILEAAGQLILQRGFDKVTVDDVAALARAGKATVYRRWSSKEDLAVAALEQLYHQELPVPDTGSVREDLAVYYKHVLEFANSESGSGYIRMMMTESLRDPRIAQLYRTANKSRDDLVEGILRRGIERGELRADVRLQFAVHWLSGLLTEAVMSGREMPGPDDVEAMMEFLFTGIGA